MRYIAWLPALVLSLGIAGRASAQEEPVLAELEWHEAPGGGNCIDAERLAATVEERLGRRVFAPHAQSDVRVRGGITRSGDRWLVTIELTSAAGDPMGERDLETQSPDCSSLDDSLALVLAVMLDIPKTKVPEPAAPAAPVPTAPIAPTQPTPPQPVPRTSTLRLPKDTPPRRPSTVIEAGLAGVASYGLLPKIAWGLRAHLAVTPPSFWKFGVSFSGYRSVKETDNHVNAGASFSPVQLGVFVCPLVLEGAVNFEACTLQHVGRLRVEGFGFDENQKQSRPYVNLGADLGLGIPLVGPLRLRIGAILEAPLLRETFRYGSQNGEEPSLFRMNPLVVTGQIGVAAQF